jgi:glycine betaine catabolism B
LQRCAIPEIVTRTPAIKIFFLRFSERLRGQHVDARLTAPNGYTAMRSYSIASAPSDCKVIELAIERLADGEVSPFLMAMIRYRKASAQAVPVAVLLSSRTYKAAGAFSAPFANCTDTSRQNPTAMHRNSN